MTAYLDKERALEYLAYLGYLYEHDTQRTALHVTRNKTIDKERKQNNRNVFLCHVIGPKGVGKVSYISLAMKITMAIILICIECDMNKLHYSNAWWQNEKFAFIFRRISYKVFWAEICLPWKQTTQRRLAVHTQFIQQKYMLQKNICWWVFLFVYY